MKNYLSKPTIRQLLSLANVVGIGYGLKETTGHLTDQEAIVVMVSTKVPVSKLAKHHVVPKSIEGIVSDVIEIGHVSARKVQADSQNMNSHTAEIDDSRESRWRPAPGGVSIGHYKITAGTLCAVVYDKSSGKRLILSNNHVLANSTNGKDHRARIGDAILQPGPADGGIVEQDTIGKLYRFIPLNDKHSNLVDAAVAQPLNLNLVVPYILGIGTVKGTVLPELGMKVQKSGRTTGLTHSTIRAIHAIVNVDYDGKILKFKDQILTNSFDQGGDSGSLVLDEQNRAVGLLFAGSDEFTVLNPIDRVLDLLDIRFN
jgi:hypothetical protein